MANWCYGNNGIHIILPNAWLVAYCHRHIVDHCSSFIVSKDDHRHERWLILSKGIGDINYLIFMIVFLALSNMLMVMFDQDLCPEVKAKEFNYTTDFNSSDEDIYEYVRSTKCEGLPNYYYLIINAPFLLGIGLIIKKYVLI